jgi:oligo-1,6-glucosidase
MDRDQPTVSNPPDDDVWWKRAVVYQIYPRSFADSDGDGMGDLPGVLEHLDHIAGLGIDVIWLSPVYASPQDDNGYDISDYRSVDPIFGDLSDLDRLVAEVHRRGMRLIMDLVVNHTSDEHPWFIESRDRTPARANWYFWRDARKGVEPGTPGAEPNNWGSAFEGSAWEWCAQRRQYYLHLFSTKQPDLNWDEPEVREAIFSMMNWWLDRGIDGFRMDVINFISKDPALPDGTLTPSGYGDGMPYFSYGPQIHAYLAEMNARVFRSRPGSYLTVGEMPGVTPEQAHQFTDRERGELNMVFQFEHVTLDQVGDKWTQRHVTIANLRETLARWQDALAEGGWNSLYWSNHDQPRVVSRYGDDQEFWYESATALATVLHLHKGTPYIYEGEELGMTNVPFDDIADFRDIESLRYYQNATTTLGQPPATVLAALRRKSRDNARTPMQWTGGRWAGFSTAEPWIPLNPNYTSINASRQRDDPNSIYNHYRRLIELRHTESVLIDGRFRLLDTTDDQIYAFSREDESARIDVWANLSGISVQIPVETVDEYDALILNNYRHGDRTTNLLGPWEARIYRHH